MAKKEIIETGKKKTYAVIFDERKDSRSGKLDIKQKMFNSNEEADVFLEELGSVKEDVRNQMTMNQKAWFFFSDESIIKSEENGNLV